MLYQPAQIEVADKFCHLEFLLPNPDPLDPIVWVGKDPADFFDSFVGDPLDPFLQLFNAS